MNKNMKILHVVHGVDTEGFLYQSDKATILRINTEFGTNFDPTPEIIKKLRQKKLNANGKEEQIAHYLSTVNFISDHKAYAKHINDVTCSDFREKYSDPSGGKYRWSWYVLDNVATHINPRRRLYGYGQVYYLLKNSIINQEDADLDGFYLHYHQMREKQHSFAKETLFCSSDEYNQILCRNIIEQRHFPSAYRAGYCLERYDSNLWLENWIPYDFSNEAPSFKMSIKEMINNDMDYWLRAPSDWRHYHPDSHDYEKEGNLKRTIFRSLCYYTKDYGITENDVSAAFERANSGKETALSTYSHEFRPLKPEAVGYYNIIKKVSKSYPEVQWRFSTATEAARSILGFQNDRPIELDLRVEGDVVYASSNKDVFGSEPYLALQTIDDRYIHQAFVKMENNLWGYKLNTPEIIWRIGIGANDRAGYSDTVVLEKIEGKFAKLDGTGYWSGSPE
jgi:hypothetical protein